MSDQRDIELNALPIDANDPIERIELSDQTDHRDVSPFVAMPFSVAPRASVLEQT